MRKLLLPHKTNFSSNALSPTYYGRIRFEVFGSVMIHIMGFGVMTPCSLVGTQSLDFSSHNKKATYSSEMLVTTYQTTRCHNAEDDDIKHCDWFCVRLRNSDSENILYLYCLLLHSAPTSPFETNQQTIWALTDKRKHPTK
jgi:hypothetical protein